MKNSCLVAAIAVISLLGLTEPAGAAVFSRGGGGSGGGSRAAALFAGAAIANRNSSWGDYGDYGGVTYVFSNSPRTDIGMQPGPSESPVQAGMVAPSPPPTTGPSQARANQDWWFQYQGSQAKGGAGRGTAGRSCPCPRPPITTRWLKTLALRLLSLCQERLWTSSSGRCCCVCPPLPRAGHKLKRPIAVRRLV